MGFIQAFKGSLNQTLADQWKDYYVPDSTVSSTAIVFGAVKKSTNNGIGENYKGAENIITNGSIIVVPEDYALITFENGKMTGCITEPGGYEFRSDDPNSKSLFAGGDGIIKSTITEAWERFKFGGVPGNQQAAFYVNMKEEISGIRFGTPSVIQWNDTYLNNSKVAAMARGEYSIHVENPITLVHFLPNNYFTPGAAPFDLNDDSNTSAQFLTEFISALSAGFTRLSVEAKQQNMDTYDYVSMNRDLFGKVMCEEVERNRQWKTNRGIEIKNVAITIEYDEKTKALIEAIAEKRSMGMLDIELEAARGKAYSENMQGMMAGAVGHSMQTQAEGLKATGEGMKAMGEGIKAAGENGTLESVGGGTFMGMNMGMNMQQQQIQGADALNAINNMTQASSQPVEQAVQEDPTQKLLNAKKLLDAGAITQEDYDKLKNQFLGL